METSKSHGVLNSSPWDLLRKIIGGIQEKMVDSIFIIFDVQPISLKLQLCSRLCSVKCSAADLILFF